MLLLTIFIILCCVYAYALLRRWSRSLKEPPLLPGAWPIIGHAHLFLGDSSHMFSFLEKLTGECLKSRGAITAMLGLRPLHLIMDPDCLTISNACLQKEPMYDNAKPWLGEGLITTSLPSWKQHRKWLNPAFGQQVLDDFLGVFNSQARRLVNEMAVEVGKPPFNHSHYLGKNALETICLTAMDCNERDSIIDDEYVRAIEQMYDILMIRVQKFWLISDFIFNLTSYKTDQDKLLKVLHNKSHTVLQKRKSEINKIVCNGSNKKPSGKKLKAFLDLLLELKEERGAFTDKEIREQVDTMIVAGHDTSAHTLLYTLVLLGSYPEIQEKVYKEIQEVFDNTDRDVEKQDLSRLVYLEAVIKESLRIYPIVPIVARYIDKELKLKNYTVYPGSSCFFFIYGLHHHSAWGKDVDVFRPERWLEPGGVPENPNLFAAFSFGRRVCIGKTYVIMSLKTTLAHLLRHYRIKADHTKIKLKLEIVLKPSKGHYISIERRV